jgi:eukaryotic-like serine/threonine-protein kinase
MGTRNELEREFRDLETKIERLKEAESFLASIGTASWRQEHRAEIDAIRADIKNPRKVDEVERAIEALKAKLAGSDKGTPVSPRRGLGVRSDESQAISDIGEGKFKPQPAVSIPGAPFFPQELYSLYSSAELIGQGGFARVYRAQRKKDGIPVAVKVPLDMDPAVGKSFLTEIENWKKLNHDNIVKLLDYNITPAVYLEMELCHHSMADAGTPMKIENASLLVLEIARGLAHSHSKAIIHRDLKPSNILMKDDNPKISDWGLSRVKSASLRSASISFSPIYAAPEQYSPRTFGPVDERTDVYQLGAIFYWMVTGETPFTGDDFAEISFAIASSQPEPPSALNPEASAVDSIIMKCLQKKKEDRYQNIAELQGDLAGFLGIDFKKTLTLSRSTPETVKLCTDLVEIYGSQGNGRKCAIYLKNLESHVSGTELRDLIQEEIKALEFYAGQELNVKDRLPGLEEIIHRARMGE